MIPISVIIPYYNGSKYIVETLNSVLTQSCLPAEILLINDGSSDEEALFLEQFKDKVTLIHQKNVGVSTTRNTAINLANNEWIAFLDQDDLWEQDKIEKQWAFIQQNQQCQAIHTAVKVMKNDKIFAEYSKKKLYLDDFLLAHPNPSYLSSTLIKKELIIKSGLFNPILPYSQDRECFIRCSLYATFYYLDEGLTTRRQHSNNLSGNYYGVWQENIKINRFYENQFETPIKYKKALKKLHNQYFLLALYHRNFRMIKSILTELKVDGFSRTRLLIKMFYILIKQKVKQN
tara:strand:+ start:1322 stop:2188 length:867 start_codon:yes stop_codon:yes gene_type:complete